MGLNGLSGQGTDRVQNAFRPSELQADKAVARLRVRPGAAVQLEMKIFFFFFNKLKFREATHEK